MDPLGVLKAALKAPAENGVPKKTLDTSLLMNCILWLNSLLQWFLSLWHKFTCVCTIVTYKTCSEDQKIFCFLHTLLCSSCISDEKNQEKKGA